MNPRYKLSLPVALLAAVALAAPGWASDEDDEDSPPSTTTQPTPFVSAPAPAVLQTPGAPPTPAAPAPTPVATTTPVTEVRGARRSSPGRAKTRKRTPRATRTRTRVAVAAAARTVPRGGVQAGAGGTAVRFTR